MPSDIRPKNRPHDTTITFHSQDELLHWQAPEFEKQEKSHRWYLIVTLILAIIVLYALFTNGPVMAITFIMIGVTGYLLLQKEPRLLDFRVTYDGVAAGQDLYEFDQIRSFWIFYDPPHEKILSLHLKESIIPFVHIPVHDEDPVRLREILLRFVPEVKQEKTLIDAVERFLGI